MVSSKVCANCGTSFRLADGRYKYCSDECAEEAHRRQCRENFRRRYATKRAQELERNRKYFQAHRQELIKKKTPSVIKWRKANPERYRQHGREYYHKRKEHRD